MSLLNLSFIILCVKLGASVVPIVLGIYLLSIDEEKRRELRGVVCRRIFGVTNAIAFKKFTRGLTVMAVGMILSGLAVGWVFVLSRYFR